ncbi:MAG TPA: DUF4037 domain-containing protein [Candidatus Binataceae bacterium]|nr:DUF4037 domain-containing protein [Candidatus Binataceae bacterium]
MRQFIPGIRLNRLFYREAVAPILASAFPDLRYSAALIGYGSDVLGYDSERSTDHEWGPRLVLFLAEADREALGGAIDEVLSTRLAREFRGYSTDFTQPDENRVRSMARAEEGRVRHHVYLHSLPEFVGNYLGVAPNAAFSNIDWLLMYQNSLLELTTGAVYHDGLEELVPLRERLKWYPHEVWLYILASQWIRLAQEESFPGRCSEGGDEVGSRINAARLVRDVMRMCFLLERHYAPYGKWLGTAFARLNCASEVGPLLRAALSDDSWPDRERQLCAAYGAIARMHNALGIFAHLDTGTLSFHRRPYRVLGAGRFAKAVSDEIRDPQLRKIYGSVGPIGSVDQFADSTNLLMRSDLRTRLRVLFEGVC